MEEIIKVTRNIGWSFLAILLLGMSVMFILLLSNTSIDIPQEEVNPDKMMAAIFLIVGIIDVIFSASEWNKQWTHASKKKKEYVIISVIVYVINFISMAIILFSTILGRNIKMIYSIAVSIILAVEILYVALKYKNNLYK